MHKLSPLNIHIQEAPIVIIIEEVNLGNTSNESIIYRSHQYTIVRPDLMGMANKVQLMEKKKKNDTQGITGKFKNMVSKKKPTVDLKSFIDLKFIPSFVLINPSDWGQISIKDKTGSTTVIPNNGDHLITLHKFVGSLDDESVSINFKIKGSNV